jgi:ABC-2 type transport system ATP-binding protein
MKVLTVSGISKAFDDRVVVDSLSLDIDDCEIVGLIGPPNSGKTTALRIIAGLVAPDRGTVTVRGTRVSPGTRSNEIAFCDGKSALWSGLTCAEHLLVCANVIGLPRKVAANRAKELLHELAIDDCHDRRIEAINAIERQRLEIATQLLAQPSILLLDEPCVHTDDEASREILFECLNEIASHRSLLITAQNADCRLHHRAISLVEGSLGPIMRDDPADSVIIECGPIVH